MQTWENDKNRNFGPNFGLFGPNLTPLPIFLWPLPPLVVSNSSKLSSYTMSKETNKPNFTKWQKNLILGPILGEQMFQMVFTSIGS